MSTTLEAAARQALTLDDLKVLRKAARCLQWAIQTESLLEKVAPGGHSNEKDYCDAAEGLKRIYEKYSVAPQTAEPVALQPLTLPEGRCASEWGGRPTGPCLYTDDEVLEILSAHGITGSKT